MRVRVRCFATLRELSAASVELDLGAAATVADAWGALADRYPGLAPHRPFAQPARNGAAVAWDVGLAEGDEVAFLPPVSGGADQPLRGLTNQPIDVDALLAVARDTDGAVVTFVGRARNRADDGRKVLELEYEAYPEMAETMLTAVADEVAAQWPDCTVGIVHRTGLVPIGDAAVVIVTASPHRSDAYAANRYVIEAIKDRLPIWKRERFGDGSEWKRPGVGSEPMDSEYREPSWRGVLVTLGAIVLVLAGLILLTSYFLQQDCVPGASQAGVTECAAPSGSPDPGSE